jgi:hypothetical protein
MPLPGQQLLLPFASLDFLGRHYVTLSEIAEKLGGTPEHFSNLVDDGTLVAFDLARHVGSRRMIRIPIEEYRRFVVSRLTGKKRAEFLAEVPPDSLSGILDDILAQLPREKLVDLAKRVAPYAA